MLLIIAVVLGVYGVVLGQKASIAKPSASFNENFGSINRLLAVYDVSNLNESKTLSCGTVDGDQAVRSICTTRQQLMAPITEQFITDWQSRSAEIATILNNSGWQKLPNFDPVTNNPVDTLPRLLEYKGLYEANVSYEKDIKHATCSLDFTVVHLVKDRLEPAFMVSESCSQSIK